MPVRNETLSKDPAVLVKGHEISSNAVARIIWALSADRDEFTASDVVGRMTREMGQEPAPHVYSEAANRELQAARRAGEIVCRSRRWWRDAKR